MANDFKVTISAVDKATEIVRKINASMAKMASPVTDFQKSISGLKDEVGLNVVAKGLKSVGRNAKDAVDGVSKLVAPMAALLGIGTIAGIAELATGWGKLGFNISKTASAIGISSDQLQNLRGAASMAGVSAGELDSGLMAIGATLEGAEFGRNQDALLMMNKFGISLHRLKDGSVDTAQGMMDISRAMYGLSAQKQHLIAGAFGVESLFSLLQKGPAVIAAYQKSYEKAAGVMSGPAIKAAADFEIQLALLHGSIDGLKNRIGGQLIPVISPLIQQFLAWNSANKDLVATKVGAWVEGIVTWVKELNFDHVITGIKALGIAFGLFLTANFLASIASFSASIAAIGGLAVLANPLVGVAAALVGLTAACVLLSSVGKNTKPEIPSDLDIYQHPGERAAHHGRGQTSWVRDMTLDQSRYGQHWEVKRGHGYWMNKDGSFNSDQSNRPEDIGKITSVPQAVAPAGADSAQISKYQLPLGIRNNNPTNMKPGGVEASYSTPEDGISAAAINLQKRYQGLTLEGIANKWTGGASAGNTPQQTANYISGLSAGTGLAPNQAPDLTNPVMVSALVKSIIKQENGQQPYSDNLINQGVAQGMYSGGSQDINVHVKFANAPAGTTAQAEAKNSAGDMHVQTRISYAMGEI